MSKNEILHELEKLNPDERDEIRARLNELDGLIDGEWTDDGITTEAEKEILKAELEDYRRNPKDVIPFEEAMADIRKSIQK